MNGPEDIVVEEQELPEVDDTQEDEPDDAADAEPAETAEEPADEGELAVTIGDEPAETEAEQTPVIRDIRKAQRDAVRALRQAETEKKALADELERLKGNQAPAVTAKPKLEDFSYDTEQYEAALDKWVSAKVAEDRKAQERRDAEARQQAEWDAQRGAYDKAKAKLATQVRNFEDAESAVTDTLSVQQQAILIQATDTPDAAAKLVAALGSNSKMLKQVAGITNPIKFTAAIAKMESQLKVTPRKTAPIPERVVSGNATSTVTNRANLDALREQARKTGDYTKLFAAKAAKKA